MAIFSVFLLFGGPAFAEEEKEFARRIMDELDVDKKGYANKKDIEVFSRKEFIAMDKNKNNLVSKEEFFEYVCDKSCKEGNCECKSYKNKQDLSYINEYWNRVDADGNGSINRQEKLANDMETFYNLDYDGNGKITKEEIEAQLY